MHNLRNRWDVICESLNSRAILDYLDHFQIDKMTFLRMIIESKIGFDTLSQDPENKKYFNEIEESVVYSTEHFTSLVLLISAPGDPKVNFQNSDVLNMFCLFHKMIVRTSNLVSNLISKKDVLDEINETKNQADVFKIKREPEYEESYTLLKKLSGF